MYQKCLLRQFDYHYLIIRNDFYLAAKNYESEAIHNLRVEIKRLRAYFQLIEWINPAFNYRDNYRMVKKLFKTAGLLRDFQVQRQLAQFWESKLKIEFGEYSNLLVQKEISAKLAFARFSKKYNLRELKSRHEMIAAFLQDMTQDYAQTRANDRALFQVKELLKIGATAPPSVENLHLLRTQAKQTRYTIDILNRCLPYYKFPRMWAQQLKLIHQILGKWHDHEMALNCLKNFQQNSREIPQPEIRQLRQLELKLEKDKKSLLGKFQIRWEKFQEQYGTDLN